MKIRSSFVSNSSSSSFVLIGNIFNKNQENFNQSVYDCLEDDDKKNIDNYIHENFTGKTIGDLSFDEFLESLYENACTVLYGSDDDINDNELAVGVFVSDGEYLQAGNHIISSDMVGKQLIVGTRLC